MYRPPSQSSNPPSRGGLGAIGAQVLADYNIPIGNRPVSHNNPRGFHWIPDTYIPYKNIKPRTRIERKALIDKETLEKQRLANRSFGFNKYDIEATGRNMVQYDTTAPGYQPEYDRFDTDFCAEERKRRNYMYERQEANYDRMREANIQRDEQRYQYMADEAKQLKERLDYLRDYTTKAKKNESGEAFDVITLKYGDDRDGMILQNQEQAMRYRAGLRAQHLQQETNRQGYNPITGLPVQDVYIPPKPEPLPPDVYNRRK